MSLFMCAISDRLLSGLREVSRRHVGMGIPRRAGRSPRQVMSERIEEAWINKSFDKKLMTKA
jgi:hypothetical protein